LVLLLLASCADRPTRVSCERAPQIDTTGNVRVCACVCESNLAAQCPMLPNDPTRSAIPACWDDESSSSGSSSE
jgi:hypothetical protein